MARLPRSYTSFKDTYPEIWQAYDRLGGLVHDAGPLDKKTRELIKLGMAIGARLEGAVHSHTRRALEEGRQNGRNLSRGSPWPHHFGVSANDRSLDLGGRRFER